MEEVDLLKKLISINTINSDNGEKIKEIIKDYFGLKLAKVDFEEFEFEGIKNFVFSFGKGEKCFAFHGHYDVVPVEREKWDTDPFEPVEKDGYIYGRGAADMKGGVASLIVAFANLSKNKEVVDKCKVILMVTGDEEQTGLKGMKPTLDKIVKKFNIIRSLDTEPTSTNKGCDTIKNGRRGVFWLETIITGVPGHASSPSKFKNPIDGAYLVIENLRNYKLTDKPDMDKTTIVPTMVHSDGGAYNVVPTTAKIKIDMRYNYGTDPVLFMKNIETLLMKNGFGVEFKHAPIDAAFKNTDPKYEKQLVEIVKDVIGFIPSLETTGGTSDARFFTSLGIPSLEIGPRGYSNNIHGNNERVAIEDIVNTRKIAELAVIKWVEEL
ncbi:M20/M25/M40 family metallo-hydrolase [Candidatus Micrarchaeota archaeon]|nr:M20/M25/M40 family metallo-hydrolase [Candidatus Micrarchaeota archaeon]